MVRACRVDDAAALAEMYSLDRAEIEKSDPTCEPSFFREEGQRDRISRVWPQYGDLAFVAIEGEKLVGLVVLDDARRSENVLVGYYVSSAYRRRGLATRALALVVELAARDYGLSRLVAEVRPDNTGSLLVARRNGFRFVETVQIKGEDHHRLVREAS